MTVIKENELSLLSRIFIAFLVMVAAASAGWNVWRGTPQRPWAFWIVLTGLALFLVAKLSLLRRGRWITFGSTQMTPDPRNLYRIGYWLMAVGVVLTFMS